MTKPDAQGNQEYTAGNILLVFFSIIIAVFSLGNAGPFISNIAVARGAAFKVFEIMDRVRLPFISFLSYHKIIKLKVFIFAYLKETGYRFRINGRNQTG